MYTHAIITTPNGSQGINKIAELFMQLPDHVDVQLELADFVKHNTQSFIAPRESIICDAITGDAIIKDHDCVDNALPAVKARDFRQAMKVLAKRDQYPIEVRKRLTLLRDMTDHFLDGTVYLFAPAAETLGLQAMQQAAQLN